MRLILHLTTENLHQQSIPVNYQYPLSAWIYHTIAEGNHEFARFLHDTGFTGANKSYKLFTFSQLQFPTRGFKVEGDRMKILAGECRLVISFMVPQIMEHFITGLFKGQAFSLGDTISRAYLKVAAVEALPTPVFSSFMKMKTISPVVVSLQENGCKTATYIEPTHAEYSRLLADNLINKYAAAVQAGLILPHAPDKEADTELIVKVLNTPRSRLILIKAGTPAETRIKGYTFDFEISAPVELIKTAFYAGLGEKNALGMGCLEVM